MYCLQPDSNCFLQVPFLALGQPQPREDLAGRGEAGERERGVRARSEAAGARPRPREGRAHRQGLHEERQAGVGPGQDGQGVEAGAGW